MNTKSKVIGAAVGALSLCGLSTAAFAFPQTPPSERAGLDLATPLPEGVYFVDIASIGGYQLAGLERQRDHFLGRLGIQL